MMRKVTRTCWLWRLFVGLIPFVGGLGLLSVAAVGEELSQEQRDRLDSVHAIAEQVRTFAQHMPENTRNALSSGAHNLIALAERWEQIAPGLRQAALNLRPLHTAPALLAPGRVSDPQAPFTALAGFTQSETSVARCGNTAVVGWNDSGSVLETFFGGPGGSSFNGVGRSTNANEARPTYTDLGFLNPGRNPQQALLGDPVVACTNANTFYYASLFATNIPSQSCISVSKSTNGGQRFGAPRSAVCKTAGLVFPLHFLDKPWMATDPTDANRLFVTYTDFDTSGAAACKGDFRTAIELVRSTNGGVTWSRPVMIRQVCGFAVVQGSQVAVAQDGTVYVAWEEESENFRRTLRIRTSTNNGTSFLAPASGRVITDVAPVGDFGLLQGAFRSGRNFPSLAVSRRGPHRGDVYLVWHDAQEHVVDFYGYANVFFSRSTDGSATWSAPVQVNTNPESTRVSGTDQYQPAIGVDNSPTGNGKLAVCWYDRRRDRQNFRIDRFCATSTDNGTRWANTNRTPGPRRNWSAVPGQDFLLNVVYMGDYDVTATDFTRVHPGFITTWGDNSLGNPDVRAEKFD